MSSTPPPTGRIDTDIPARLDRLPWGRFHWLFVCALGVTWILDGLEVTVVGAVGNALLRPDTLGLDTERLGLSHTGYLIGAVAGALLFGHLTDRLGRKKLFTVTLLVYVAGAAGSALAWDAWSFIFARVVTGLAIGGEYAAINSAIDELIPARVRGRVDLAVNGTFWLGAILGAGLSGVLLNPDWVPVWLGWRLAFGVGAIGAAGMIVARQFVPESPRWLLVHGRVDEAEEIVRGIEAKATGPLPPPGPSLGLIPGTRIGFREVGRTLLVKYRARAALGLILIASQAFFFNGLYFSFPLVLKGRFGVADDATVWFIVAVAASNLLGPLLLGHFFDTVGRRRMIAGAYTVSGLVVVTGALLFAGGLLTAVTLTAVWAVAFFFASAAASAGYLTVSEIFPVEMRAMAIALFYALGTAVGGSLSPLLFGYLLKLESPWPLVGGFALGGGLMVAAAVAEWFLGVDAEGKGLEDIAAPLSAAE